MGEWTVDGCEERLRRCCRGVFKNLTTSSTITVNRVETVIFFKHYF